MHKNRAENFADQKRTKTAKRTRVHAKTAEVGCVLGAGEGGSGWRRMKPGEKTRCPNPNEHQTMQHMQKENLRNPSVFAGFLAGAEGLGLGCRLGRLAAERHWRSLTPRHAPQAGLRAHLVAKSYRTLTKKSGIAEAIPDFFGRGRRTWSRLPPRSVRGRAPLALAHLSARGFGVDVGERTREREKADVIRFPPQVPERAVLVWCCEKIFVPKQTKRGRKSSNLGSFSFS